MKSLFKWVANNAALSFLLGLELFCLVYGTVLTVSVTFKTDKKKMAHPTAVVAQVLVIAEDTQKDFVYTEMEVFEHSNSGNYKVVTASRSAAIEAFENTDNAILILSGHLDENALDSMNLEAQRLPLQQEVIDQSVNSGQSLPVFIQDNTISPEERKIAQFLIDNHSQDLVFQKLQSKAGKNNVRNS